MPSFTTLIDRTYFTGELTIGQVETPVVEEDLKQYIRKHEYDFLSQLMGKSLFSAFYDGMQGDNVEERWKRMAYGYTFIVDQALIKKGSTVSAFGNIHPIPRYKVIDKMNVVYNGLLKRANSTESMELAYEGYGAASPIAKYVYYWYNRAHATASGGVTESKQQVHNGTAVTNAVKMVRAWNEMCVEVFQFYLFLDMHIADYPEFELDVNARFNPAPINEFNFL